MRREQLPAEEALSQGTALPHAYIRSLSEVTLGPVPEEINAAELLEARFFSGEEEVRIFRVDGGLQAVRFALEPDDRMIEEAYELGSRKFGKRVTVRHVLAADEDGQCSIAATVLTGWEVE